MAAASSRARARKIVLVVVGLVFFGAAMVPVVQGILHPPRCTAGAMLNSVLATLGVFLVLAARNPSAYRSLIIFGAWSSFAHAAVMALMAIPVTAQRTDLLAGAALTGVAAVLLMVFAPERASPAPDGAAAR
jgi:hypothetical protein